MPTRSPDVAGQTPPPLADTLHRRYFTTAILITLAAGAVWGIWLLWSISNAGRFTGVSIHPVNAHGHAQIYGWVGLFIMGFAYQAFPRMWRGSLVAPRLAVAAFVLMVTGLALATLGMTLGGEAARGPALTALIGVGLQSIAVVVFAMQILLTFLRSPQRMEPYVAFIMLGAGWFVAHTVFSGWHHWRLMTAETHGEMLLQLATYQPLLRNMQLHGMALLMVLGVSMRVLPNIFGVRQVGRRRAWIALALLTAGLVVEMLAFVAMRLSGAHMWGGVLWLAWLMLAIGCVLVVWPWRLWRPTPTADRSAKFVRAAYAWLAVSLLMTLVMPLYTWASGLMFSHAYYGAVRHAFTVGFLSLMIMGIGSKMAATLSGMPAHRLTALWWPFLLVNIGCIMRVAFQTGTDWHAGYYQGLALSGVLELVGLAIWGVHMARLLFQEQAEQVQTPPVAVST